MGTPESEPVGFNAHDSGHAGGRNPYWDGRFLQRKRAGTKELFGGRHTVESASPSATLDGVFATFAATGTKRRQHQHRIDNQADATPWTTRATSSRTRTWR